MPVICDLEINLGATFMEESINSNIVIDVFPNPASELFIVKLDNFRGQAMVSLANNLGVVLLKRGIYSDGNLYQFEIDIASLQIGFYYLNVDCEGNQVVKKVIVY
jgi:hypothetical protein